MKIKKIKTLKEAEKLFKEGKAVYSEANTVDNIKTVGDLISALSKFSKNTPVIVGDSGAAEQSYDDYDIATAYYGEPYLEKDEYGVVCIGSGDMNVFAFNLANKTKFVSNTEIKNALDNKQIKTPPAFVGTYHM